MKSPMLLWKWLAAELGSELSVDTSRDIRTVSRRVEHEGDEFLTITLPTFRKALERSLAEEKWNAHACTAFAMHGGLPCFLGGFLELVFDRDTGCILEEPDPMAVAYVRQLTGLFGSLEPDQGIEGTIAGCTEARVNAAYVHYLETEESVGRHVEDLDVDDVRKLRNAMDAIFSGILSTADAAVYTGQIRPRHSSGATADRLKGNQKWTFPTWTERLEEVFPYLDNTLPSASLATHRLDSDGKGLAVTFLSPEQELPVRVIPVPKTVEKPRLISAEPSYMQYMQQAIMRLLVEGFETTPLVREVIQLHRRESNQFAARVGSIDGSVATLDLKDASDRLSNVLVSEVFSHWPWLSRAIAACRSTSADVGGAGIVSLHKFAGMGSALTFPIQTMVFTAIAFLGIAEADATTVPIALRRWHSKVRVYGDDIIVPTHAVASVIRKLEAYGFVLNTTKSFWTGRFRESCGGDYFCGHDVGYVKIRTRFPDDKSDAIRIVSAVSLRNRFYNFGFWKTASRLDDMLEKLLRVYPTVTETSELLGRVTYVSPEGLALDTELQVPIAKGYVVDAPLPKNRIDGVDALTRYFYESSEEQGTLSHLCDSHGEVDRFDRSGRPKRVTLKLRTRPV